VENILTENKIIAKYVKKGATVSMWTRSAENTKKSKICRLHMAGTWLL